MFMYFRRWHYLVCVYAFIHIYIYIYTHTQFFFFFSTLISEKDSFVLSVLITQVIRRQSMCYGNFSFFQWVLRWSMNAIQEIIQTGILAFVVLIIELSNLSLCCLSHQLVLELLFLFQTKGQRAHYKCGGTVFDSI